MRRIVLTAALLCAGLAPCPAAAQVTFGGFLLAGGGGGRTSDLDPRFSVDAAYTMEIANRNGPYFGARYTLGMHRFRANEQALAERHGGGSAEGGGGTLYDTGGDVEVGYGVGVVRVYGFTGIHYYQQYHDPLTLRSTGGETVVITSAGYALEQAYGAGLHMRLTDTGAVVAEWYRGGGGDVMRLSGTRFGLRWAW